MRCVAYVCLVCRQAGIVVGLLLDMPVLLFLFLFIFLVRWAIVSMAGMRDGEAGQLGRCWLHGQRIFSDVEGRQGRRIADKDLGKLSSEASGGGDGPSLDTFAHMKLKMTSTLLTRSLNHVHGDGLCLSTAWAAGVEGAG